MYISPCILGHYYLATLNRKGGDLLAWSLVSAAYDGEVRRIPAAAVPKKIWRKGYALLIEHAT